MALTTGFFENSYTFNLANIADAFAQYREAIENNAIAVITYLSDYISWNGTIDFVVNFRASDAFGWDGSGLLPSYGGVSATGQTFAEAEATTGIDANGADWDAGCYILPNSNGTLTNYDAPLFLDPDPDPYARPQIPAGSNDFFSIYLHEVMHSFGFWSTAQHGPQFGQSTFDTLTIEKNGQWFFAGGNTQRLLGQDLPLARAVNGSRDHYGTKAVADGLPNPIERGLMFEFGNYEQNRWQIGQVDLAVLKDLGFTVANQHLLPMTEQADATVFDGYNDVAGDEYGNILDGTSALDRIVARAGNDVINSSEGADILAGGDGSDTVSYLLSPAAVSVDLSTSLAVDGHGDLDVLLSIENLTGSAHDDTLIGNHRGNVLLGGSGADSLFGGAGTDTISGVAGNDSLLGEAGHDLLNGDAGRDTLLGGDDNDTLNGGGGIDLLQGEAGNDRLNGGNGSDEMDGGAGNDWLIGGAGNNFLTGGDGADRFVFRLATVGALDIISDFDRAEGDRIVLSDFGGLVFIGAAAFNNVAGEMRATSLGGLHQVQADLDGDGVGDLLIDIVSAPPAQATWFVL